MTPEERAERLRHRFLFPEEARAFREIVAKEIVAAIAEEREACAATAEGAPADCDCGKAYGDCDVPAHIAAAIRARG